MFDPATLTAALRGSYLFEGPTSGACPSLFFQGNATPTTSVISGTHNGTGGINTTANSNNSLSPDLLTSPRMIGAGTMAASNTFTGINTSTNTSVSSPNYPLHLVKNGEFSTASNTPSPVHSALVPPAAVAEPLSDILMHQYFVHDNYTSPNTSATQASMYSGSINNSGNHTAGLQAYVNDASGGDNQLGRLSDQACSQIAMPPTSQPPQPSQQCVEQQQSQQQQRDAPLQIQRQQYHQLLQHCLANHTFPSTVTSSTANANNPNQVTSDNNNFTIHSHPAAYANNFLSSLIAGCPISPITPITPSTPNITFTGGTSTLSQQNNHSPNTYANQFSKQQLTPLNITLPAHSIHPMANNPNDRPPTVSDLIAQNMANCSIQPVPNFPQVTASGCNTPGAPPNFASATGLKSMAPMFEAADITAISNGASGTRHPSRFYKTKVCPYIQQKGKCSKGYKCVYAHSLGELRGLPNLEKTKLCPSYKSDGTCSNMQCPFAHTREELRHTDNFYKTKLCHMWKKGKCAAATLCRHAHGSEELNWFRGVARQTSQTTTAMSVAAGLLPSTLLQHAGCHDASSLGDSSTSGTPSAPNTTDESFIAAASAFDASLHPAPQQSPTFAPLYQILQQLQQIQQSQQKETAPQLKCLMAPFHSMFCQNPSAQSSNQPPDSFMQAGMRRNTPVGNPISQWHQSDTTGIHPNISPYPQLQTSSPLDSRQIDANAQEAFALLNLSNMFHQAAAFGIPDQASPTTLPYLAVAANNTLPPGASPSSPHAVSASPTDASKHSISNTPLTKSSSTSTFASAKDIRGSASSINTAAAIESAPSSGLSNQPLVNFALNDSERMSPTVCQSSNTTDNKDNSRLGAPYNVSTANPPSAQLSMPPIPPVSMQPIPPVSMPPVFTSNHELHLLAAGVASDNCADKDRDKTCDKTGTNLSVGSVGDTRLFTDFSTKEGNQDSCVFGSGNLEDVNNGNNHTNTATTAGTSELQTYGSRSLSCSGLSCSFRQDSDESEGFGGIYVVPHAASEGVSVVGLGERQNDSTEFSDVEHTTENKHIEKRLDSSRANNDTPSNYCQFNVDLSCTTSPPPTAIPTTAMPIPTITTPVPTTPIPATTSVAPSVTIPSKTPHGTEAPIATTQQFVSTPPNSQLRVQLPFPLPPSTAAVPDISQLGPLQHSLLSQSVVPGASGLPPSVYPSSPQQEPYAQQPNPLLLKAFQEQLSRFLQCHLHLDPAAVVNLLTSYQHLANDNTQIRNPTGVNKHLSTFTTPTAHTTSNQLVDQSDNTIRHKQTTGDDKNYCSQLVSDKNNISEATPLCPTQPCGALSMPKHISMTSLNSDNVPPPTNTAPASVYTPLNLSYFARMAQNSSTTAADAPNLADVHNMSPVALNIPKRLPDVSMSPEEDPKEM